MQVFQIIKQLVRSSMQKTQKLCGLLYVLSVAKLKFVSSTASVLPQVHIFKEKKNKTYEQSLGKYEANAHLNCK